MGEQKKDETQENSKNKQESKAKSSTASDLEILQKANPSQKFSPAVELLLNENNISRDDAIAKIQATGPNEGY